MLITKSKIFVFRIWKFTIFHFHIFYLWNFIEKLEMYYSIEYSYITVIPLRIILCNWTVCNVDYGLGWQITSWCSHQCFWIFPKNKVARQSLYTIITWSICISNIYYKYILSEYMENVRTSTEALEFFKIPDKGVSLLLLHIRYG